MKHKLIMLLLALVVVPAWAGEAATPAAQTAVTVQLSGSHKGVQALLADLEKDAAYKESGCSAKPMKKSAKMVKISCSNASGALLDYLSKNTQSGVRWNISGATAASTLAACPAGCSVQTCSGVTACFKRGCIAC